MDSVDFAALDFFVGAIAAGMSGEGVGRLDGGGGTCWETKPDDAEVLCGWWLQFMIKVQAQTGIAETPILGSQVRKRHRQEYLSPRQLSSPPCAYDLHQKSKILQYIYIYIYIPHFTDYIRRREYW